MECGMDKPVMRCAINPGPTNTFYDVDLVDALAFHHDGLVTSLFRWQLIDQKSTSG